MYRVRRPWRLLLPALALALPALAHHGWGGYTEDVELTLRISELRFGNPHDRLVATDADGVEWNLLLAPPARNRRFGFGPDSVTAGMDVEVYGRKHPRRAEVKVHCLFAGGATLYTYRYDDGRSSLKREGSDERC